MDFFTQFCTKHPDWRRGLTVFASLWLVSCSQGESDFGFKIERIETLLSSKAHTVVIHQKIALSPEAENALKHGVTLDIQTEFTLRNVASRSDINHLSRSFKISYLPLSNLYQLTTIQPSGTRTFPRLRHVLAELSTVSFKLPGQPLSEEKLEIRARSFLDRRKMPPPMRLPTLFLSQWQHDSGWQIRPVESDSDA